ncbi:MAG TPA: glycerophosphodiester phosphodiesterase family protein [Pirellulaceae bacterium]
MNLLNSFRGFRAFCGYGFLSGALAVSLLLNAMFNTGMTAEPTPAQTLVHSSKVLIIAHRGNSSVAPENTLPAFQSALDAKADLIELDYYHAADGVPVVIHDEILDRTTNSEDVFGQPKLVVGSYSSAELKKIDAGSWFDEKFANVRIPTLLESLNLIQSGSVTLVERKQGDADTIVRLLKEKNLLDKVVVQAFDWKYVARCRELAPNLALATLSGKPAAPEQIEAAAATGADVIVWDHQKIGRREIEQIHKLGKKAWAYTIDDVEKAKQLVAAGLDGVITNKPAEMMKLRK